MGKHLHNIRHYFSDETVKIQQIFFGINYASDVAICIIITMNPGLKNVSICSQHENCQISLKIVTTRSQNSS